MMNTVHLAPIMVALTATPALAQPGADELPPPPPPARQPDVIIIEPAPLAQPPTLGTPAAIPTTTAPMTNNWSEVSHINGQLVPVGQRGDYLYKFRKTNISTNPIGMMFGIYGFSVSHALNEHVALRGDVTLMNNAFGDSVSGSELGASAVIYFKRTYSGPFIEPGLIVRTVTDYDSWNCGDSFSSSCEETTSSVGPSVVFGWHWMFDSGLNVAFAAGAMRNLAGNRMNSSNDNAEFSGYFRVGYAF